PAPPGHSTLSLHGALPSFGPGRRPRRVDGGSVDIEAGQPPGRNPAAPRGAEKDAVPAAGIEEPPRRGPIAEDQRQHQVGHRLGRDRKSTRLNSSHVKTSYA